MFAILFGLSLDHEVFLLNESPTVKMIGFGLAVAVLVDATAGRMVLVPSTMVLRGHANWRMPRWLDRVLPRLHVEGERGLPPAGTPVGMSSVAGSRR